MKQFSGLTGVMIKLIALVVLAAYLLEIGFWRSIVSALLVGAFVSAVFGSQGWRYCVQTYQDMSRPGVWRPYVRQTALLIIFHAALVQLQDLDWLPKVGWINLGPSLQSLEGDWHIAISSLSPPWSAWAWVSIYIFGFPALLIGTVIALHGRQHKDQLMQFLRASHFVAWVALPVFAIVAVPEVWIQLPEFLPPAATVGEKLTFYRFLSGPYNCLPSLHCTLALLALMVSWNSGIPVLRWLGPLMAILVCLSTLMSGVHWLLDMLISLPLAWFAWAVYANRGHLQIREANE